MFFVSVNEVTNKNTPKNNNVTLGAKNAVIAKLMIIALERIMPRTFKILNACNLEVL